MSTKISNISKGYRLKLKSPLNHLQKILIRMTNWQNSQWLRHANDKGRGGRSSLDTANYFLNLVKPS